MCSPENYCRLFRRSDPVESREGAPTSLTGQKEEGSAPDPGEAHKRGSGSVPEDRKRAAPPPRPKINVKLRKSCVLIPFINILSLVESLGQEYSMWGITNALKIWGGGRQETSWGHQNGCPPLTKNRSYAPGQRHANLLRPVGMRRRICDGLASVYRGNGAEC